MIFNDYTIGSTGQSVTTIQEQLNQLGFPVAVNGVYSQDTRAAVEAFQIRNGTVVVDGMVGPDTLSAMDKELNPPPPASVPVEPASFPAVLREDLFIPGIMQQGPPAETKSNAGLILLALVGVYVVVKMSTGNTHVR